MELRSREKENKQNNIPRNKNRIIEIDKTFLNNLILAQFSNKNKNIIGLDLKTIHNSLLYP